MEPLLTFGHGQASREELTELLRAADVRRVVDVRRFPGSRRHPHVARAELEQWLPTAGVTYRWEERLGGRRRTATDEPDRDPWWRVAAFAAYAAHTRTPEFRAGLDALLGELDGGGRVVVMCSESLWWRCHRRLVADVAVLLHGVPTLHLGHDGSLTEHAPAEGARVTPDGLVYDGPADGSA
ncbi:DUF488 family protein [Nocardioides solisilvae]|uniref:DUF488 domain-containing protein n=1 Tax=Nocardioides solisilvae TaxID=1542435 RepID=UPI000D750897|nr:DUF488 domain-containing protein [Nocardioides solisilvae]